MALTDRNNEQYWNEYYETLKDDFIEQTMAYDSGDKEAIEVASHFAKHRSNLKTLDEMFKIWQDQNLDNIIDDAEKYGKEGFQGFKFSNSARQSFDYSTSQEYVAKKKELKEIENKMKTAYLNTQKGIQCADENGEEIPLPKVKFTKPSLKTEKLK